jgi:hypothetical protein
LFSSGVQRSGKMSNGMERKAAGCVLVWQVWLSPVAFRMGWLSSGEECLWRGPLIVSQTMMVEKGRVRINVLALFVYKLRPAESIVNRPPPMQGQTVLISQACQQRLIVSMFLKLFMVRREARRVVNQMAPVSETKFQPFANELPAKVTHAQKDHTRLGLLIKSAPITIRKDRSHRIAFTPVTMLPHI